MVAKKKTTALAEEEYLSSDISEIEETEDSKKIPLYYDPSDIDFGIQQYNIGSVVEMISRKEIIMSPDWQRMANIWKYEKKSRLIESILIKIPIPAFYMHIKYIKERKMEEWSVIDGLQRLSILNHFINGINNSDFELEELKKMVKANEVILKGDKNFLTIQNLEYMKLSDIAMAKSIPTSRFNKEKKDYDYITYEELDGLYKNRIWNGQITIFTIKGNSPIEVVYNIFERINTGGLPLSPQEIRNAIRQGPVTKLLNEMVKLDEFKVVASGLKTYRMEDRELALRFIFFYRNGYENYDDTKDFNIHLLDVMQDLNLIASKSSGHKEFQDLKEKFKISMVRCMEIFGEFAFRRIRLNKSKKPRPSKLNKALFECLSVTMAHLSEKEYKSLYTDKNFVRKDYIALLTKNKYFLDSISRSTTSNRNIEYRFEEMKNILKG